VSFLGVWYKIFTGVEEGYSSVFTLPLPRPAASTNSSARPSPSPVTRPRPGDGDSRDGVPGAGSSHPGQRRGLALSPSSGLWQKEAILVQCRRASSPQSPPTRAGAVPRLSCSSLQNWGPPAAPALPGPDPPSPAHPSPGSLRRIPLPAPLAFIAILSICYLAGEWKHVVPPSRVFPTASPNFSIISWHGRGGERPPRPPGRSHCY